VITVNKLKEINNEKYMKINEEYPKINRKWRNKKYITYLIIPYLENKEVSYSGVNFLNKKVYHQKENLKEEEGEEVYRWFHRRNNLICNHKFLREILNQEKRLITDLFSTVNIYDPKDIEELLKPGVSRYQKKQFFKRKTPKYHRLVFDIDSEGDTVEERIKKSYNETLKLCRHLNDEGYRYVINFSGGKGFHVRVDEYIESKKEWKEKALRIAEDVCIDDSIYSSRREFRVPYSLHGLSGLMALPLNKREFREVGKQINEDKDIRSYFCLDRVVHEVRLLNRKITPYKLDF